MTDLVNMTAEEFEKVREIIASGGKLYVHPSDFEKLHESTMKAHCMDILDVIVQNRFIQPGMLVAMKSMDFGFVPFSGNGGGIDSCSTS